MCLTNFLPLLELTKLPRPDVASGRGFWWLNFEEIKVLSERPEWQEFCGNDNRIPQEEVFTMGWEQGGKSNVG